MTWQDKAEWLWLHGYDLSICAVNGIDNHWMATINGEGRRYSSSIEDAICQVYEWVVKESKTE